MAKNDEKPFRHTAVRSEMSNGNSTKFAAVTCSPLSPLPHSCTLRQCFKLVKSKLQCLSGHMTEKHTAFKELLFRNTDIFSKPAVRDTELPTRVATLP